MTTLSVSINCSYQCGFLNNKKLMLILIHSRNFPRIFYWINFRSWDFDLHWLDHDRGSGDLIFLAPDHIRSVVIQIFCSGSYYTSSDPFFCPGSYHTSGDPIFMALDHIILVVIQIFRFRIMIILISKQIFIWSKVGLTGHHGALVWQRVSGGVSVFITALEPVSWTKLISSVGLN